MKHQDLTTSGWRDYELIDSGDGRKLERYGDVTVVRPETQALWAPRRPGTEWTAAGAEFRWAEGKGAWRRKATLPEAWELSWGDARFTVRLTSFKHTGVFPEQAVNWEWIAARAAALGAGGDAPRILNLFGYTGIASIVAARAGALVTHVDASNQSNRWSKENAMRSGIPDSAAGGAIRYLLEDALKFAEREARRGNVYEGIVLDPPAFGRGPKGEVWHIEESLPRLLAATANILSRRPGAFFLLNGYAAGYAPRSFAQAVEGHFPDAAAHGEYGELRIAESGGKAERDTERVVPSGIYVRFVR